MYSNLKSKIQYFTILLLTVHCSLLTVYCFAQSDLGIPSITGKPGSTTILRDYEAIGINPSNLGWDDNDRFSLGLAYLSLNLQSNTLNLNELINSYKSNNKNFSDSQQNEILKLFVNNNNGLNFNTNVTLLGLSFHFPNFGGISFSIRDRVTAHFSANVTSMSQLDTLIKQNNSGNEIASITKSANINIQYLREFNVSYGRKIKEIIPDLDLYGGIGYRYILGLANVNLNDKNGIATSQTSFNYNNFTDIPSNLSNPPGKGNAIDLGVNAVYLNKFKFGFSFDNIGFINWHSTTNAMIRVDSLLNKSLNVNTFDKIFNPKNFSVSYSSSTIIWLPSKLRIGGGIKVSKFFEVGADVEVPLNTVYGYKDPTFMSLGSELNIFHCIKLNFGVSGNPNFGWNIPLGLTISAYGLYDIYFATNDILTFVGNTKNPMVSFAFCGIRFNIPPPRKS